MNNSSYPPPPGELRPSQIAMLAAVRGVRLKDVDMSGVSFTTFQRAHVILAKGTKAQVDAIIAGKASLRAEVETVRTGLPRKELRSGPPRNERDYSAVREQSALGHGVSEIARITGLTCARVNHILGKIRKPKGILEGITQDVEVFAESLESRSVNFDNRWLAVSREEAVALTNALRACRSAAQRIISQMNGIGDETNDKVREAKAKRDDDRPTFPA